MKNKTLFSVTLPAVAKSYDLWIPDELSVHDATKLIIKVLEERERKRFMVDSTTSLYHRADGVELDLNKLVGEHEFIDGTELILA